MKQALILIAVVFPALLGCLNGVDPEKDPTNPVTGIAGSDEVRSFLGGSAGKLVFVNVSGSRRTLCMIDFAFDPPSFTEYTDAKNVFMPVISPDGKYVAYCTNNEGQSGPCATMIRPVDVHSMPVSLHADPAYIPRWWVHPVTRDTCIVYTNSATYNESVSWQSTGTFRQKVQAGIPVGSGEVLADDGSFHDGLSRDGTFLVTGFNRLLVKNLRSGSVRQLFTFPGNGKDSLGSTQVCNVSLSPDTGVDVRCLFLDFGCPGAITLTGSSYGIHQYLFISNLADSVVGYIKCPEQEQTWEYAEWSNHPDYAVACLRNNAGKSHAIALVNITDGTRLVVASGTELQHPALHLE